jgi:hypothetical protein
MIKLHNANLHNLFSLFYIVRILNQEETQRQVRGYGEVRIHKGFEQRRPKENNVHYGVLLCIFHRIVSHSMHAIVP